LREAYFSDTARPVKVLPPGPGPGSGWARRCANRAAWTTGSDRPRCRAADSLSAWWENDQSALRTTKSRWPASVPRS